MPARSLGSEGGGLVIEVFILSSNMFIRIVLSQASVLKEDFNIDLRVLGIISSKSMLLCDE